MAIIGRLCVVGEHKQVYILTQMGKFDPAPWSQLGGKNK